RRFRLLLLLPSRLPRNKLRRRNTAALLKKDGCPGRLISLGGFKPPLLQPQGKVRRIVTSSSYACNNRFLACTETAFPSGNRKIITIRRNECSLRKPSYGQQARAWLQLFHWRHRR